MGSFSIAHWLIVAVVVLVLFGRGRISETMADFGKGIASFRKGMAESDDDIRSSTANERLLPKGSEQPAAGSVTLDSKE